MLPPSCHRPTESASSPFQLRRKTPERATATNCPWKEPEEDKQDKQEVTAGLAAAKEISIDAAVEADISEVDAIFTLREEERHQRFLLVASPQTEFGRNFVKHRITLKSPLAPVGQKNKKQNAWMWYCPITFHVLLPFYKRFIWALYRMDPWHKSKGFVPSGALGY